MTSKNMCGVVSIYVCVIFYDDIKCKKNNGSSFKFDSELKWPSLRNKLAAIISQITKGLMGNLVPQRS